MKIFVINLERSTTRRAFMKQQLDAQQLDYEFIKAVDGAVLTEEYLAQVCNFEELGKYPHQLRRGVYGCQLSHYNVYQKIVADDLPYALIMEDDVTVDPSFSVVLAELALQIKPKEIILLFSQNNYMPTVLSTVNAVILPENHLLTYPITVWAFGSAAGYIIGRDAAQSMADSVLPMCFAADAWPHFYHKDAISSLRLVTPFLVKPAGFKSDIDYVNGSSLLGKALAFIDKHEIPPFKQILTYRRRKALNKTIGYSFTDDPSPIPTRLSDLTS